MYDKKLIPHADPEMREFEESLMRSLEQLKQIQAGDLTGCIVHTPEDIAAMKRRGRPIGTTKSPATLRVDDEALARWRATGKGWQTRAAAVLAAHAP